MFTVFNLRLKKHFCRFTAILAMQLFSVTFIRHYFMPTVMIKSANLDRN